VRNGLLSKRRSAADARRVELRLTARAKAALESAAARNKNELARLIGVLRARPETREETRSVVGPRTRVSARP